MDQAAVGRKDTAPPGFENVVLGLKGNPDVGNPFAAAWSMHDSGIKPKSETGKEYDPSALYRRLKKLHVKPSAECVGAGQLGALTRKGVKAESVKSVAGRLGILVRLREAAGDAKPGGVEVVLITAGPGNQRDKNFYPAEALQRSAHVFEGVKCFLDHPTASEEQDRPERSVRDQCGWFSNVRLSEADSGAIVARLNYMTTAAGKEAGELVESELAYQKQYPSADKVLIGFSINAEGPSHREERNDGTWNVVDGIENVMSVDLVTFPARGGKVLGLREAQTFMESKRWRQQFDAALKEARTPKRPTWRDTFARLIGRQAA